MIETFVPDAGGPPEGTHKVMVAASIDEQRGGGPRAYYLWRRGDSPLRRRPAGSSAGARTRSGS